MTDYYSVLARAVVSLETEDGGAREELYERARRIIISELRKQNPKIQRSPSRASKPRWRRQFASLRENCSRG
jgi:hypothetical protein